MQREVFLEENKSKLSVNSESNIAVNLTGKQRLLPFDSAAETMSLYKLYNRQRDNCEKYRLIFNINPFCTNVLFNAITEPVWKEGSDEAICLNFTPITKDNEQAFRKVFPNGTINQTTTVDARQAVKDTEYSHPDIGGIVYHCGYDIFNNHLLRTEDFLHVQKSNENTDDVWSKFNTIEDYLVDNEGDIVEERGGRSFRHLGKVKRHMYQYDNCTDMVMAYLTKISEENGWYGFINTGYINIPNATLENGKEVSINRIMNNNKPCEFYDMYPDRSLFSFIPKVNKWRKRLEKNWDYCITYPYYSDIEKFNELNETPQIPDSDRRLNALKVIKAELKYTNNGIKLIRLKTLFDHGLSKGSYVRFYYNDEEGKLTKYYMKVRVQQVGDYEGYDSNKYFSVAYDDVADFIKIENDGNEDVVKAIDLFVRQEKNGVEFNYYLRRFRKIKYGDKEPRSEINKTAYQETIYGDRAAQIVYTDDVDVSGLVDNLGRPLTTLYLTIIKTNRGHNEWYGHDTGNESVEFSHCFGKVTSGFDFGNDTIDYNVRKLHNIKGVDLNTEEMLGWVANGTPKVIEDDITISGSTVGEESFNDEFYGDVACYDTYNLIEHIIMPIYHRFNTAQRELVGDRAFRDIFSDEIHSDDFDYEGWGTNDNEDNTGTVPDPDAGKKDYRISSFLSATTMVGTTKATIPSTGNNMVAYIVVESDPAGHQGILTLNNEYTGIRMEKNGDVYAIYFNENNTDSERTVTVTGTITTPQDPDYKLGTSSLTVNYEITQESKEFPYGYEIMLEANPLILEFEERGTAKATVRKVTYFEEGREGEENVRTREIINVEEYGHIEWETEFTPAGLAVHECIYSDDDENRMSTMPYTATGDTLTYRNNNVATRCDTGVGGGGNSGNEGGNNDNPGEDNEGGDNPGDDEGNGDNEITPDDNGGNGEEGGEGTPDNGNDESVISGAGEGEEGGDEEEELKSIDIEHVKIKATFVPDDGKPQVSDVVEEILLKAEIPDEEPTVWTYELKITPQAATATTLNSAKFSAVLYATRSGSTMPEPPDGTDVTTTATWELEGLDEYATIDNGTVINNGTAEEEMSGQVKAKIVDGNGDEQDATATVTITQNLGDEFQIFVEDDHVVSATQVTISVTSKSDTNGQYNTTKSVTANSENPAQFMFEKGNTNLTYRVQVTRCNGDGSTNSSYSLYQNGEVKTNISQLNSYIASTYYEFNDINGSVFKFEGTKSHITLNTVSATTDFGSIQLRLFEQVDMTAGDPIVDVETQNYESIQSNEFYLCDFVGVQSGTSADNIEVLMSGQILEKLANYSLIVRNSIGTIIKSGPMNDLSVVNASKRVQVPRNGFLNSTWYITRNQPTYSLEVKSSTDVYTIEYSGTLQYEAWLVTTDGDDVQRENVTSALSQDRTIITEWSLADDARSYAIIGITGETAGLVTNMNETSQAHRGLVIARYKDTNRGIDLIGNAEVMLSQKIEEPFDVRVNIGVVADENITPYLTKTAAEAFSRFGLNIDNTYTLEKTPSAGNYLIGGSGQFELIPEFNVQNLDDILIKTVTFKWRGNDLAFVNREILSEIGLYITSSDGTVNMLLGTLDMEVSPPLVVGNYTASTYVRNDLKTMDIGFKRIKLALTGETIFETRNVMPNRGVVLAAAGEQKLTAFTKDMLEKPDEGDFTVSSVTLNMVDGNDGEDNKFYGNLNPEGYFYQPHTQIRIRQLSEDIMSVEGTVINFNSACVLTGSEVVETYDPETNEIKSDVTVYTLSATSPTNLDFVEGMEFIIYNKETGDSSKMGRLLDYDDKFESGGCLISLWVNAEDGEELEKLAEGLRNKEYMLVLKKEYAPRYAIFQPKLRQFIWRDVVPQSELRYDDDLYDMIFANGRFYIHTNMNFFLRRQDPQNAYHLQSPNIEKYNPLKKFRIMGRDKVDTSSAIYSLDNLIDCF